MITNYKLFENITNDNFKFIGDKMLYNNICYELIKLTNDNIQYYMKLVENEITYGYVVKDVCDITSNNNYSFDYEDLGNHSNKVYQIYYIEKYGDDYFVNCKDNIAKNGYYIISEAIMILKQISAKDIYKKRIPNY